MDRSLGWYSGYILAIAHMDKYAFSDEEKQALTELSGLLQGIHERNRAPGR